MYVYPTFMSSGSSEFAKGQEQVAEDNVARIEAEVERESGKPLEKVPESFRGLARIPAGARLAKLTFRGGSTYEPELSRVARTVGVDYSILSGRISRIRGEPYGQLVVAFTGGDAEAAVAQLTARGVVVEAA